MATIVQNIQSANAIEAILADFCAKGADPLDVGQMVVEGVRAGQFVIGTTASLPDLVRVRSEALERIRRELESARSVAALAQGVSGLPTIGPPL